MEKVDCIISGDYIVTSTEAGVLPHGAVAVKGNRIVDVGDEKRISMQYTAGERLGGANKAVIPGLINTHTHAGMVFMRGMADDIPLHTWLEKHVWPTEQKWISAQYVADATALAVLEMLKSGVTTYADMYYFAGPSAPVVKRLGMRAVLAPGVIDFPTKTTKGPDDCLINAAEFISRWKGDPLITPAIAPHSAYTCSPDTLRRTAELAGREGVIVMTHLSETEWEVSEISRRHGILPAELLDSVGLLNEHLICAHCVWLSEAEIDLLSAKGVKVAHCIESNLKLGSGIAPVPRMLDAGIKVSIGTDGAASNNDLSIISEMSTVAKVHKGVTHDPTVLDAKTVFSMATGWGAYALGMHDLGCIEVGNLADIVIVDLNRPHLLPLYDIHSQLVYSLMPSDVESVMVDGRVVLRDRKLVSADEDEIMDRARHWGRKIKEG